MTACILLFIKVTTGSSISGVKYSYHASSGVVAVEAIPRGVAPDVPIRFNLCCRPTMSGGMLLQVTLKSAGLSTPKLIQ